MNLATEEEKRASFLLAWVNSHCSVSGLWSVWGVPSGHPGSLCKRMGGVLHCPSPETGELWWGKAT